MINLAGMEVVDVSVHGALDYNPKATLHAMGVNPSAGGCDSLIWLPEQALLAGQVVRVTLLEACEQPDRGRTMEELFPDDEPCTQTDFTIDDAMAAQLRARPQLHQAFAVQASTSQGQQAAAVSDPRNTSFTFGVVWDFTGPDKARVRLTTHCLDDVLARRAGSAHLEAMLALGDSASFVLTA
ncbi:hypothetical protein CD932_20905 [Janthinobacterium sp. PC23-8]|nr:hypothetical protein CD932_20905 [Janthinobacterium sp. PC23-8]